MQRGTTRIRDEDVRVIDSFVDLDVSHNIDVSLVICTRNRANRLGGLLRALADIRTGYAWEVLLVDNASTDGTADVLARADDCGGRLRYLHCDRIGSGAARDHGWRAARGRIIASTDDDCYPAPDYIDAIADVFARSPDIGCVGGRILLYDPLDARTTIDERTRTVAYPPCSFIDAGELQGANLAILRTTLEAIGGYDADLGAGTPFPCEDIDVVAATLWSGKFALYDPVPTVEHHHRRREADVPALEKSYDAGRGAYYAKYLLRADTRMVYLRALARLAFRHQTRHDFERLSRELRSGLSYLVLRRAYVFTAIAVPVGLLWYGFVALVVALRAVGRRGFRRFASS